MPPVRLALTLLLAIPHSLSLSFFLSLPLFSSSSSPPLFLFRSGFVSSFSHQASCHFPNLPFHERVAKGTRKMPSHFFVFVKYFVFLYTSSFHGVFSLTYRKHKLYNIKMFKTTLNFLQNYEKSLNLNKTHKILHSLLNTHLARHEITVRGNA